MKRKLVILVSLFSVLLSACAATDSGFRIDGSSAASTEQGIMAIKKNLRDQERFDFTAALLAIQVAEITSVEQFLAQPDLRTLSYQTLANKINGMTYREILALAKQSKAKVTIERVGPAGL